MSQEQLAALVREAGQAATAGQWAIAEQLWQQVRALDPNHMQALFSLGVHAHQRGDHAQAVLLLQQAQALAPRDPMLPLTLSVVYRTLGQADNEWQSIIASLALDAYFLPGVLAKAEFLERSLQSRAAAAVFRDALNIAPAADQWPPSLRRRLQHAQDAVAKDTEELLAFLQDRISVQRDAVGPAWKSRWDEAASIMAGRTKPYHSVCNQLYVPRLPALTFYDRTLFPWIPELEARTEAIRAELHAVMNEHRSDFEPYVAYRPGEPVNQWKELNHSLKWSSLHLWAHGEPQHSNLSKCPRTAEALTSIDAATIPGMCPNAMFSVLAPHTAIPPHHGETNARLVAHLPLVVPEGCEFRVGFDRRRWEEGQVLVFDDTLEHEAINGSDVPRAVLIFDVWNPLLSDAERVMVTALSNAMREYRLTRDPA